MNDGIGNGEGPVTANLAPGALGGIKVLDLSRVLSGPFATMTLADMGADVVKVEEPTRGDDTRQWGPPFQEDQAAYFLAVNRNKRSVAIDMKSEAGHAAVRALADWADVIVENFRPGTAERLGLGYAEVSRTNPRVVYASISGYGQTGPDSQLPGYDAVAQARSGLMSVTGEPGRTPVRVGVSSTDLTAGMWALVGILAALYRREETGRGQWIDVSLLDGQISWLTYVASGYFATGKVPQRYGSAHPTIAPYQAFDTTDGSVMIAVGNDGLWARFLPVVGLEHLADDPRFVHNPQRIENRDELIGLIAPRIAARPTAEWVARLSEAGVPAGPVNTVDQVMTDPQVVARDMVWEVEHPTAGHLRMVACPLKMSESTTSVRLAPPLLGQHTDEVLAELGLQPAKADVA
jgi:formyl-CoA transferase/CoA:oxalate CoA-transferase